MKSCIGVDLHLRTATLCHLLNGQQHCLRTLTLHSSEWHEFWDSVPPGSHVLVEMSRTTWWFARWVQECGHQAHVVDPAQSRAVAVGRPKTDRCDARWLAEMGAKDVLYEVYVIHPQTERPARTRPAPRPVGARPNAREEPNSLSTGPRTTALPSPVSI